VVLTIAAGANVVPDVYDVSIDAAQLAATNGDLAEQKADQLWVDVTGENTLKPITVQPDGSFAVSGSGEFLGYGAPQTVLADNFAGNGRTDLLVLIGNTLLLLNSNGAGTYAAPVPIPLGASYSIRTVNTVDWNHDGSPDLVVGVASSPDQYGHPTVFQYLVLLNDGHGNFTNAPETPIPVTDPDPAFHNGDPIAATGLYDLSGNGTYDIVHNEGSNAEVIGKDSHVGYTPQMEIPMGFTADGFVYPTEFTFADLNGDGKPDIIAQLGGYYADNPGVSVSLSTPTGFAAGTQVISPFNAPVTMGVGAFTAAGQQDLAVVYDDYRNSEDTQVGDVIQVLQNDGKGNFTTPNPIQLNRRDVAAAIFGDVNKDGLPDLVLVLTPSTGQYGTNPTVFDHVSRLSVWTLLADGHGGFAPTTPAPVPLATTDESAPSSISLADLDGDGYPDLVLGSSQSGEIRLAINDGTGTMRPPTQPLPFLGSAPAPSDNPLAFGGAGPAYKVFADFNNSGHQGFVTITPTGLDVYVGQSDGVFKHTESLSPFGPAWVQVGDLNNDGIPDMVCGDGTNMAVYLGNGDGTFREAPTFMVSAPGNDILNVTLADVDNDGHLDAVATLRGAFAILFGDGKGDFAFNANTEVPITLSLTRGTTPNDRATLADFNGDGKRDLLVPTTDSQGAYTLTDYLGNGNGTFTPGPVIYSGGGPNIANVVGDLNGDGKLDLIALDGTVANIYLGDGKGGFNQVGQLDLTMGDTVYGPRPPAGLVLGDFNGDGKLDLAASDSNSNVVDVYPGDGTGHFGSQQAVMVGDNPLTLVSIPRAPFLDAGSFAVTDQPPTANNITPTAFSGTSLSIPVLDNVTEPDKAPLTVTQVSNPAHGSAHITAGSGGAPDTVLYVPAAGFSGSDTFTYTVADPAGVTSTGTVSVTVQPIPVVKFSSATYSVDAAVGSATMTVTCTGLTTGSYAVDYATSDGTAVAGQDYTAASGTLTFQPGQASQTFTVAFLPNGSFGASPTVNLTLRGSDKVLGTAVLTLTPPQPGTLGFSVASYAVDEGAGVTITVTRTGGSDGTITAQYATQDSTATAGVDYTASSGTLTFAQGVTSQSFTIPTRPGPGYFSDQSFAVDLTGTDVGNQNTAGLTIHDTSLLQFNAASYGAAAGASSLTLTVTRSGSTTGTATVHYTTSDQSAAGTLTFGPGSTSQSFTIPAVPTPAGQTTIYLGSPTGAALGNPYSATLTIPAASNPGSGNPGSGNPGSGNPGSGNPGSGNPGSGNPGSGNPSGGAPSVTILTSLFKVTEGSIHPLGRVARLFQQTLTLRYLGHTTMTLPHGRLVFALDRLPATVALKNRAGTVTLSGGHHDPYAYTRVSMVKPGQTYTLKLVFTAPNPHSVRYRPVVLSLH
jgi:hypothetical protein